MKNRVLSAFVTVIATTSTVFAQPGTNEAAPPPDPMTSPPPDAVVAQPPPSLPVAEPDPESAGTVAGTDATGIAVELRLDTNQVLVDDDLALPGMGGGFFVGHRSRALTIGLGFDLLRLNQSQSGGGMSAGQSVTSFLVSPGVRFVLARTPDTRTELLLQADAGYGLSLRRSDNSTGSNPPSIHRLRVQAGPSLRHWITSSFAVGGTAGLRYDRSSLSNDDSTGGSSTSSFAITSVFASLQLTAVF